MMSRIQSLRSRTMHQFWGIALGLCATFILFAWHMPTAHAGSCTFASKHAGNQWHEATNWSCGGVPTSTSPVIIPAATTTNITYDQAATAGSVNILGTLKPWGSTLSVYGNWNLYGTFTAGTSTVDFTGTASQYITGTAVTTFNNVTVTKSSGTVLSYNNVTIGGTLATSNGGTLNISTSTLAVTGLSTLGAGTTVTSTSGTLSFGSVSSSGAIGSSTGSTLMSALILSGPGVMSVGSGTATSTGNVTINGTISGNSGRLVLQGDCSGSGSSNFGTGTVVFYGTLDQAVRGLSVNNLEVRKASGTVTINTSGFLVGGTLTTIGGGTLSSAAQSFTVTGASTIGTGTTVTSTTGTMTFTGAVTSAGSIGSISGNQLFGSTLTNTGSFSVGSGYATTTGAFTGAGTVNGDHGILTVQDNFTGETFNRGTGTLRLYGTSSQNIDGKTFYNLDVRKASGTATITTANATVAGTLNTAGGGTLSIAALNLSVTGTSNIGAGTTATSTTGTMTFTGAVTNAGSIGTVSGNKLFTSTLTNTGSVILGSGVATTTGAVSGAGTIKADSGTLVASSTLAFTTFNAGASTLILWGTDAQNVQGATYYNVELKKRRNTSVATVTGSSMSVAGTLTTYEGTLSSAALNLSVTGASTIGSGTTVTSTSGTLTFTGAVNNAGNIGSVSGNKLLSSTLFNSGTFVVGSGTATTTGAVTGAGTIENDSGTLSAVANLAFGDIVPDSGTIRMYGGANQIISIGAMNPLVINNLEIRKTANKVTFNADTVTLNGSLTTVSAGTLDATDHSFTVTGASTIGSGTTVTSTSGALTLGSVTNAGDIGSDTGTILFTSLTNTAGTVDLLAASTSTGSVTLSGGTLYLNSNQFNVGGGWVNSGGTFTPSSGTVRFYGTGTRNIGGEANFYNLTFNNTGLATLTGNVTSTGAFRVGTGGMLAISTYRFKPAGSSYTNLGKITIGTGGKIVYALDSAQLTDNAGTHITTNTNPGIVYVKIQDKDANLDGTVADTITTTVTNDAASGADSESMTLTETGVATGIFMNTMYLPLVASASIVHNNGQFEINAGGVQTMSYVNAHDLSDTGTDTVTMTLTGTTPGGSTGTGGGGGGGGSLPTTTKYQTSTSDPDKPKNLANLASQGVSIHALVKLADDGNVNTQEDSAVYYIGADGRRHAFPNSKVFFTWYTDFGGVQVVSAAQMASIPLGKNAIYKPGIKMVKFITLPDTYLVTSGGNLRWVKTEAVAKAYYGNNWNQQIDDINDTFFSNYKIGDPINASTDVDLTGVKTSVVTISDALSL